MIGAQDREPNAAWRLLALVAPFCLALTFFLGLPSYVEPMAHQLSLADADIGRVVFSHMTGLALGTLFVAMLGRLPQRVVGLGAIMLNCAANLLPWYYSSLALLTVGQAAAGFGAGILVALGMQQVARSANPNRNLSVLITAQATYTILLVQFILPAVDSLWKVKGQFALISVLVLACTPAMRMARGAAAPAAHATRRTTRIQRRGAALALFALFLFFMSVGVLWTFVERLGADAGLAVGFITTTIAVANLASIPLCLTVPLLIARMGVIAASRMTIAVSCIALVLLFALLTPATFAIGVTAYLLAWSLGSITLFATVPFFDAGERLAAVSPGCALFGAASGSLLGGILATAGGYRLAMEFSLACSLLALLGYWYLTPPQTAGEMEAI